MTVFPHNKSNKSKILTRYDCSLLVYPLNSLKLKTCKNLIPWDPTERRMEAQFKNNISSPPPSKHEAASLILLMCKCDNDTFVSHLREVFQSLTISITRFLLQFFLAFAQFYGSRIVAVGTGFIETLFMALNGPANSKVLLFTFVPFVPLPFASWGCAKTPALLWQAAAHSDWRVLLTVACVCVLDVRVMKHRHQTKRGLWDPILLLIVLRSPPLLLWAPHVRWWGGKNQTALWY